MNRVVRYFRKLPLRSRLSVLSAVAVAFAVAAVSVTCWFIVHDQLYSKLDDDLRDAIPGAQAAQYAELVSHCTTTTAEDNGFGHPQVYYVQVVDSHGTVCVAPNSLGTVEATSSDRDIARRGDADHVYFRNGVDSDGKSLRVATRAAVTDGPARAVVQNLALTVAVPLTDTDRTLNHLALVLLIIGGSESSAREPPDCGWPAQGSAPSTNSPTPSNTWPVPRISPSGSPWRATTRSHASPRPSTP